MEDKKKFMAKAIELSINSANTIGGPFGSVIVKDNKIIAEGSNKVTSSNDPTAHGEIVAIREACKNLNTFDLSGCEIYTSCEPCPMCLSAIYWSRLDKIYYANTREDAKNIDFDDSFIYSEIPKKIDDRKIKMVQMLRDEALKAFQLCSKLEGIIPALEPSHALGELIKIAPKRKKDEIVVMNMCGRGDKDIFTVAEHLSIKL